MRLLPIFTALFLLLCPVCPAKEFRIVLLEADNNSRAINDAFKDFTPPAGVTVDCYFPGGDNNALIFEKIKGADLVLFRTRIQDFRDTLIRRKDEYAGIKFVSLSKEPPGASEEERKFFKTDRGLLKYSLNPCAENYRNMILKLISKEFDSSVKYEEAKVFQDFGVYHPDAPGFFNDFDSYLAWLKKVKEKDFDGSKPWAGVHFLREHTQASHKEALLTLFRALEAEGLNVMPFFGELPPLLKPVLLKPDGSSRADVIISFGMKFAMYSNPDPESPPAKLNVPILNAMKLYRQSYDDWEKNPAGLSPFSLTFSVFTPETAGLIEPRLLSGKVLEEGSSGQVKSFAEEKAVAGNIALEAKRAKRWAVLRRKANAEKKVAILYYNNGGGKAGISASYLDVPASVNSIMSAMRAAGYNCPGGTDSESLVKALLANGRNIGSWAPGELETLAASPDTVRVPISVYKKWLEELPPAFVQKVVKEWGPPETFKIMTLNGCIIIPAVKRGNVVLAPVPMRGWGDDPEKLYHSSDLQPHHQYLAAYIWLRKEFGADAVIHLGRHGTVEWLPGKQCGLSPEDAPAVVLGDLPNINPYIVDGFGEGAQSKRRGSSVIIDHMTPVLKPSGLQSDGSALQELMDSRKAALAQGSAAPAESILRQINEKALSSGLARDLGLAQITRDNIGTLEERLDEMKAAFYPSGLRVFGVNPPGAALEGFASLIREKNPGSDGKKILESLAASGPLEMKNLLRALNAEYIMPGESGDPVRNIKAIPTGLNFYGFSPDRIPTQAAWALGKQAAESIIKSHRDKNGRAPRKVAMVLWALESIRNEGVNESAVLWLMGAEPQWDENGRVTGIGLVPGARLGRPRTDVMVTTSGMYRDSFPNVMRLIAKAAEMAAAATDVENFLAENSAQIKRSLMEKGASEADADAASKLRVFSPKPGAYGTGVNKVAGASGIWQKNDEIAKTYINRMRYATGTKISGAEAGEAFELNLAGSDSVAHSRSSYVYGVLDNDDMFQYMGGLALAVEKKSGKVPVSSIMNLRNKGSLKLEDLRQTITVETRARYLNPRWIEDMKQHGYAGAQNMAKFTDNLWGWQSTVESAVPDSLWTELNAVYAEDKYKLGMKEFFNKHNPWAFQSISARMLEAIRKGCWSPGEQVKNSLAAGYAQSVAERGVTCCDHTCNNPALNQMVMTAISIPGVLSPETAAKFKLAVEKAAGGKIGEKADEMKKTQERLQAGFDKMKAERRPAPETADKSKPVKGLKMRETKKDDKNKDEDMELSSSGFPWLASLAALAILTVVFAGFKFKRPASGS